ncbi:DUF4381 family protein [Luteolibacter sp. SL250]|uniref:DUF4381 family protein n=1 Tax=Luteolibacter sp. SL250 TaxID=2995170 RepID=UPI0022706640|nr:DUF4381 family protein [Luteolibacter sp. SL250]WAC18748.1 DUF4381 family protein [Luteolibacter sp. SL250]
MKETPPDITDDFTLVAPPEPLAWLWPAVIALAVLLVIGLIVWRLYRKRRLPFQEPAVPPEVAAREGLEASRKLLDEGRYKEFVVEVSRVLRVYIEDRFALRAPHLSTEEFLFEAERSDRLSVDWQNALGDFLFQCDKVKFALANTEQPRMEALYATAERFISKEGGHSCPPSATGTQSKGTSGQSHVSPSIANVAGGQECPPSLFPQATPEKKEDTP